MVINPLQEQDRVMGRDREGSLVSLWHKFTRVGKTPLKVKCHSERRKSTLFCQRLSYFTFVTMNFINKYINKELPYISRTLAF